MTVSLSADQRAEVASIRALVDRSYTALRAAESSAGGLTPADLANFVAATSLRVARERALADAAFPGALRVWVSTVSLQPTLIFMWSTRRSDYIEVDADA